MGNSPVGWFGKPLPTMRRVSSSRVMVSWCAQETVPSTIGFAVKSKVRSSRIHSPPWERRPPNMSVRQAHTLPRSGLFETCPSPRGRRVRSTYAGISRAANRPQKDKTVMRVLMTWECLNCMAVTLLPTPRMWPAGPKLKPHCYPGRFCQRSRGWRAHTAESPTARQFLRDQLHQGWLNPAIPVAAADTAHDRLAIQQDPPGGDGVTET